MISLVFIDIKKSLKILNNNFLLINLKRVSGLYREVNRVWFSKALLSRQFFCFYRFLCHLLEILNQRSLGLKWVSVKWQVVPIYSNVQIENSVYRRLTIYLVSFLISIVFFVARQELTLWFFICIVSYPGNV
jgi:hypothetical protein